MDPEKKPIKSLRTYQGDVEEILSHGKASATTILVAEQKRKEESPQKISAVPKISVFRNKLFITISIILIVGGIIIVSGVYFFQSNQKVIVEKQTKALLPFSKEIDFSISGFSVSQFAQKINSEKNKLNIQVNSILYLQPTNSISANANIGEVLPLFAPRMPASLARSFENSYMFGIYSFDHNEPFVILTTKDYPSSYAGMLRWEKDMPLDLSKSFGITLGSTTQFEDEAYKNKDLRVVRDSNQNILLLYSFIDKQTLVITTNENILSAIIGKYFISQQSK